jgi:hypothetical protein
MQEQIPSWDSAGADLDLGSEPTWSSPERPPQSSETVPQDLHEPGYSEFCESIQEEGGAFYQIGADLFVVNGWDPQKKISKVLISLDLPHTMIQGRLTVATQSSWHHLQRTTIGNSLVTVCQCPLSRPDGACVHQQFLTDYGEELFPFDAAFTNGRFIIWRSVALRIQLTWRPDEGRETEAVLFSRQELQEDIYLNHFSSTSPNSRSLSGRVIVEYSGDDTGSGRWVCAKDSGTHSCSHINKCRDLLQRLVQIDPSATDQTVRDGTRVDYFGAYQLVDMARTLTKR